MKAKKLYSYLAGKKKAVKELFQFYLKIKIVAKLKTNYKIVLDKLYLYILKRKAK